MTLQFGVRLGALSLALAVAACSSMKHQEPPPPPPLAAGPAASDSGNASTSGESARASGANLQGGLNARGDASADSSHASGKSGGSSADGSLPDERLVHFAYDSDALSAADTAILAGHAAYLKAHPTSRVRLEGHADERGTQEYNMALGERRAKAARFFLLANGGRSGQIDVISYGKTKPVDSGDNEEAWAKNRRVEVVYR